MALWDRRASANIACVRRAAICARHAAIREASCVDRNEIYETQRLLGHNDGLHGVDHAVGGLDVSLGHLDAVDGRAAGQGNLQLAAAQGGQLLRDRRMLASTGAVHWAQRQLLARSLRAGCDRGAAPRGRVLWRDGGGGARAWPSFRSEDMMAPATTWFFRMSPRFGSSIRPSLVVFSALITSANASSLGANSVSGPGAISASFRPACTHRQAGSGQRRAVAPVRALRGQGLSHTVMPEAPARAADAAPEPRQPAVCTGVRPVFEPTGSRRRHKAKWHAGAPRREGGAGHVPSG